MHFLEPFWRKRWALLLLSARRMLFSNQDKSPRPCLQIVRTHTIRATTGQIQVIQSICSVKKCPGHFTNITQTSFGKSICSGEHAQKWLYVPNAQKPQMNCHAKLYLFFLTKWLACLFFISLFFKKFLESGMITFRKCVHLLLKRCLSDHQSADKYVLVWNERKLFKNKNGTLITVILWILL